MTNPEVELTLDDAVAEVLNQLTGLDLTYEPEQDRYRSITRQVNRALRSNALENEWGYYSTRRAIGTAVEGMTVLRLSGGSRPRIINDDAVTLVDGDGQPQVWAYFLPRDAIHKYSDKQGLWVASIGQTLRFSRPLLAHEEGMSIEASVMREPEMFRLPAIGEDVPDEVRSQPVDFDFPDVIIARAAFYYAQTDPIMQPRVQTLEAIYKDLMYQLIERDTRMSDAPYINETIVPVQNGLMPQTFEHRHPHGNSWEF
jgi:hypothetical protein